MVRATDNAVMESFLSTRPEFRWSIDFDSFGSGQDRYISDCAAGSVFYNQRTSSLDALAPISPAVFARRAAQAA